MDANSENQQTIQIKVSTLRMAAMIGLGVLLVGGAVVAIHTSTGPKKVTFRAFVDGTDVVKISGHRLWIEHLDMQPPVRMKVNGEKWNPTWDGETSTAYKLRRAFTPGNPEDVKFTKDYGRGEISILEKPMPENDQTLAIKIDDGPYGGAAWYEFTVSW